MQLLAGIDTECPFEWPRQNCTGSILQDMKLCPRSKQCRKPNFCDYKMFRPHFLEQNALKET